MKALASHLTRPTVLQGGLIVLFTYALWRTAWASDDAFITLRSIDNLVNGYGMTWNPAERVQAFTHPLWYFVLSIPYFLSREAFFTTIFVSMAVSLVAFSLLAFKRTWTLALPAGLAVLIMSKAYIDYSTSGLENPLTHVLLILFGLWFLDAKHTEARLAGRLGLIAGLLTLNRMDLLLLVLPALLYIFQRSTSKLQTVSRIALGFLPFVLWEIFSVIYYGFPFPNTAYAKLNAMISQRDLLAQGWWYFVNSISRDPLTLPVIGLGMSSAFLTRNGRQASLALGVVFYLAYILWIGGDFMSGRFFTAPLLVCVMLLLERFREIRPAHAAAAFVLVFVFGWLSATPNLLWKAPVKAEAWQWVDSHLIADERMYYFETAGLVNAQPGVPQPRHWAALKGMQYRKNGAQLVTELQVGYMGYFAGPHVHILDRYALADPLLARIPFSGDTWRIGHLLRKVPRGYEQTLRTGENRIQDPALAEYYSALSLIVRGELFTRERWLAIWQINSGGLDDLIKKAAK
jgi:arabinofuranosyltransferase